MALKGAQKELAAQEVPAQLHCNLQPEPRSETSGPALPKDLMQRKASTITAQKSIMLIDKKLCGDKEGKSGGNRALPQHTMEPLASSVEELAPD